jgi:ADP-ribosyltransferase exoenzyme
MGVGPVDGGGSVQPSFDDDDGGGEVEDAGDEGGSSVSDDSGDGGGVGSVDGTGDVDSTEPASGDDAGDDSSADASGPTDFQRQYDTDSFEPAPGDSGGAGDSASQPQARDADDAQATSASRPAGDDTKADADRSADTQKADAQKADTQRSDAQRSNAQPIARASVPASSQQQPTQRFQVAMSPENRAHLARQQKEITEKANQFSNWASRTGDWFQRNVPGVKQLNQLGSTMGDFAGTWGMKGAQAVGADKWKVPDAVMDAADKVTKPILQNQALMDSMMTQERFNYGVGMEAAGTVEGLHTMATRPGEVLDGLKNAASHPIETGKQIGNAVKDAWNKDPVEFAGRAAFEVGSMLIPGAGEAGAATKAGEVAEKVGTAARVAEGVEDVAKLGNGLEKAGQVGTDVGRAAQVATGAKDAAKVGSGAEKLAGGAETAGRLRQGTAEFDQLAQQTAAKEELARRLRGTLDGRNELAPGGRGHAMSGATPDMPPEQIRAQINKLEQEASVNRSKMAVADPPLRPELGELTENAGKEASKLTNADFTKKALGYPEDLTEKFKPGEIESMRTYLGNEVRGDPLDPSRRFVQSDLHDGLDELSKGFTNANGVEVPPGDVSRINFQHINGQLRGTRTDLTPGQLDRVNQVVKNMDTAMEKSALQEPLTVYRVNKSQFTRPGADGLIAPDKAFQSTGRTPQLGFATEDPSKYTVQIIELDKGQHVFDMDALTRFNGDIESFRGRMPSGVPNKSPFGEQELLLPRNTQLKVTDSWVDAKTGMTVQRVKVVR